MLNPTCKGYRINQYQKYLNFILFSHLYNIISLNMSVHSVYTHIHPSKGKYNKDAEIKTIKISFAIDLFYNPYM